MIFTMEEIIFAAESFAEHFTDGELDYTPESLALVEEYLDDLSCFDLDEASAARAAAEIGSYVSETARRCYGGEYRWSDRDGQPVLVAGLPDFAVAVMTWDKVRARLSGCEADSIPYYIQGYKEHIQKGKKQRGYNVLLM